MQGAGWTKVTSKRSGFRWDIFPFGGRNQSSGSSIVTSFFVSEFPEYYNARRLFELFGCSGKVVEVAISPRRNRFGKRFAFARFMEVEDGRRLAIRLDNILIEGKKLHVNLPRFNRLQGLVTGRKGNTFDKGLVERKYSVVSDSPGIPSGALRGVPCSYADVVGKEGQGTSIIKEEVAWLNFQSNQVLRSRFERAFVGRVCIPGSAYNIQNYLEMEGVFTIKVTPLGGNCCLLEDKEEGFIGDLIKEGETWGKSWFFSIEKWEAGKVDGRRDVWLRIYGVPIHVWSSEFFVSLGDKWGRFVCIDDNTAKGEAFDVARILINIPITLIIPDCVSVCIDGSIFKLCIREDSQGLYRSVNGYKKDLSSDGSSSESDSDRFLMSDFGESMRPEDRVVSHSDSKVRQTEALPAKVCFRHSGVVPEVGCRRRNKDTSGVVSEGICRMPEGSVCRACSDDARAEVVILCKESVESDANVEHGLALSSRKNNTILRTSVLERDMGEDQSGSGDQAFTVNSVDSTEVASKVGNRSEYKVPTGVVSEGIASLIVGSDCRTDTGVVRAELDIQSKEQVESEAIFDDRMAHRSRKVTSKLKKLDLVRGKGEIHSGSDKHACAVDFTEPSESASCSKTVNLLCLDSKNGQVLSSGDSDLLIRNGGSPGLVPNSCTHSSRISVSVSTGDPPEAVSSKGGTPAVFTSNRPMCPQAGFLQDSVGASERDLMGENGLAISKPMVLHGKAAVELFPKQCVGEGKKIKKWY